MINAKSLVDDAHSHGRVVAISDKWFASDRHAAYLIKARRTNLHPKAGYIDADFLSPNFSRAVRRADHTYRQVRPLGDNPDHLNLLKMRLRRHVGIVSGLPVIRPEPRNLESLVSALFGERLGDLSSTENGS